MKWTTQIEYVDQTTGEIMNTIQTKRLVKKEMYIIVHKQVLKTEINENHGKKRIRYIVRRNNQLELWGEHAGNNTNRGYTIHSNKAR